MTRLLGLNVQTTITGKETLMKFKVMTTIFALALVLAAGFVTHSLTTGTTSVLAFDERNGQLHATMDCSAYTGAAGGFCVLASSNLDEIKVGSKQYMDQAAGSPPGILDSNVVFVAGTGDWAVGRCTLDLTTFLGLCTFSDGTGPLAGFHARVNLSPAGGGILSWNGTYRFSREHD
jgi:hypothetical protein